MEIVPFDKRDGYIWQNGKIIPWQDAKTHILNHGLHYASCVFEGERVLIKKSSKAQSIVKDFMNLLKF